MNNYVKEILEIPLLKKEETEKLIMDMQEGNMEARSKLIEHNLIYVVSIAYKIKTKSILPMEDLINIGTIGLIKGIDKFKFKNETDFKETLIRYIKYAFNNHSFISKAGYNKNYLSLDELNQLDEEIKCCECSCEEKLILKIKEEKIIEILKNLTEEEIALLYLIYGVTNKKIVRPEAIAKKQGVSISCICDKERKALKKIERSKAFCEVKDYLY